MLKRICLRLLPALSLALLLPYPAAAQGEKLTAYGVLLDNSGSLERQLPQVLLFGEGIVRRIHRRGPVALFNFTAGRDAGAPAVVSSGVGWSQDEGALAGYLRTISVERQGRTNLLDAIGSIAAELDAKAGAEKDAFGDKVIILITDGEHRIIWGKEKLVIGVHDEADERRRREGRLVKALKASGIRVYAVGLTRALDGDGSFDRKSPRENAENFLRKITKETGGRVVFPGAKKTDVDAVLGELLAR